MRCQVCGALQSCPYDDIPECFRERDKQSPRIRRSSLGRQMGTQESVAEQQREL
ncbi:hypothetical protein CIB84_011070 [Bambusicola thoracicus]|uniref:Uncharacterized protein n=1 Tax=Bambusicola thoracicus TaxID=9083 RepID=A0A2P4SM58_BAMTH|nr:hypothetical protein CIB84_011070 [Bambusicola thoracicus]